jgi:DNA-binding NtrC family response regulator
MRGSLHQLIAALPRWCNKGRFREDLFYRLNVLDVKMPALREHVEDIPVIAQHFLDQFCVENGLAELRLSKDAGAALSAHHWRGNARELRNVIQRCATEADSILIKPGDLRDHLRT